MKRLCRSVAVLGTATLLTVVSATPASAHTITGIAPTNYESRVTRQPKTSRVSVRVLDLGRRVELTNRTQSDVVILGYDNEPYLRAGPRGAFENYRSPAHFVNRVQPGGAASEVPAGASSAAAPEWHRLHRSPIVRWRDRRTRWEGPTPPAVQVDRHRRHVVSHWTIALALALAPGTGRDRIEGTITWVPPPPGWGWLIAALWIAAGTAFLAALDEFDRPIAGATSVLIAVDIVHSVAQAAASPDAVLLVVARAAVGGIFSVGAWIAGAIAVRQLARKQHSAVIAVAVIAFLIMMLTGVGDAGALGHSQIPSVLPPNLVRGAVTVTLGLGAGLVVAGLAIGRRSNWWTPGNLPTPPE